MKLGTVESVKFKKLKARLRLTHWECVGLLESIWHFASRNAPRADIGRHSDDDIAVHIEWTREATELVAALVECRWIDRHDEHRLIIHDWPDHLPGWLKGNLIGRKLTVFTADGEVSLDPKTYTATEVAKQPPKRRAKGTAKHDAKDGAIAGCSEGGASLPPLLLPPHSTPLPTTPSEELPPTTPRKPGPATWLTPYGEVWQEAFGGTMAFQKFSKPLKDLQDAHGQPEVLERWMRYCDANTGKGEFASAQKFSQTFGQWARDAPGTDLFGTLRNYSSGRDEQ